MGSSNRLGKTARMRQGARSAMARLEESFKLRYLGVGFIWAWVYCSYETSALYPDREGDWDQRRPVVARLGHGRRGGPVRLRAAAPPHGPFPVPHAPLACHGLRRHGHGALRHRRHRPAPGRHRVRPERRPVGTGNGASVPHVGRRPLASGRGADGDRRAGRLARHVPLRACVPLPARRRRRGGGDLAPAAVGRHAGCHLPRAGGEEDAAGRYPQARRPKGSGPNSAALPSSCSWPTSSSGASGRFRKPRSRSCRCSDSTCPRSSGRDSASCWWCASSSSP